MGTDSLHIRERNVTGVVQYMNESWRIRDTGESYLIYVMEYMNESW